MPGDVYLPNYDYGAGYGYAPTGQLQTLAYDNAGGYGSASHTSFVIWTIVIVTASVVILHGLKLGGFSFVYKR